MRFTPKSNEELEKEAAARGPFSAGVYDFEFTEAVDDISKAGNDMITVTLKIYNEQGESRKVKDYLMESMAFKLRHACETSGLSAAYEAGEIEAADFVGRSGRVKIKVKRQPPYADKNEVADYIVEEVAVTPATRAAFQKSAPTRHEEEDVIPF